MALVISPAKASVAAGISYAIKSLPAVAKPSALVAKNPGLKVTTSFSRRFAELAEPVSDKDITLINDLFEKMEKSKEADKKMTTLIEKDSDKYKEHLLYLHTSWSKVSLAQIQSLFLIPDASQRDAVRNKIEAEMVQQAPAPLASALSDNATHESLRKKIDAVCLTAGSVKSDDEVGQSYRAFMAHASDAAKTAFEKTASTLQITTAEQLFDHI